MNDILRKTPRSKRFMNWLFITFDHCQRCSVARARDIAHPPKRRPWGGGTGLKASDLGSLRLCRECHDLELAESFAWSEGARDLIAILNLSKYAETLDPSVNLLAELGEKAQLRVILLEADQGGES